MSKYEEIYQKLRKQYSDNEIADSMLIPAGLTDDEKKEADQELREFRFRLLKEQQEEDRIYSDLMRFKLQLEHYVENGEFTLDKSFGKHLEEYVRILKRTKKQLAQELQIHYTRFSRIINSREEPNVELTYRLEEHSAGMISAVSWWKLISKKQEYTIRKDISTQKKEASKVTNAIKFSA